MSRPHPQAERITNAPRTRRPRRDVTFASVAHHIEGELVPVLHAELARESVYFERHVLRWKHTAAEAGVKPLGGAFSRLPTGMPIFRTEARGTG